MTASIGNFINTGQQDGVSLAASITLGPFRKSGSSGVLIRTYFESSGTFDAVGTLAVKVGETAAKAASVAFEDENQAAVTTKAVTDALDETAFHFIVDPCPEGKIWLVYTSTSDGDDDTMDVKASAYPG